MAGNGPGHLAPGPFPFPPSNLAPVVAVLCYNPCQEALIVSRTAWSTSSMKLLIAIVQDYDCDRLLRAVTSAGYGATRLASTGGFLRMGNTTVLIGIEDERVPACLRLIEQTCRTRVEVQLDPVAAEYAEWYAGGLHEVTIGGAVVFQLRLDRFERITAER